MSNEFLKLMRLKGTEDILTPSESQRLNDILSKITIDDIPDGQEQNIEEYIVTALLMNSIEEDLVKPLEILLEGLRNKKWLVNMCLFSNVQFYKIFVDKRIYKKEDLYGIKKV